jgi:hypothetical protein
LALRERVDPAQHELVAIGRRFGDPSDAGHATRAAYVLDDHLLAQDLGQASAENASCGVGGTAGRERDHHGDRSRRPVLRSGHLSRKKAGRD